MVRSVEMDATMEKTTSYCFFLLPLTCDCFSKLNGEGKGLEQNRVREFKNFSEFQSWLCHCPAQFLRTYLLICKMGTRACISESSE